MHSPQPLSWSLRQRKACITCTQAKRRCDKSLPSCQRCIDKEVSCRYPATRPYARRAVLSAETIQRRDPRLLDSPPRTITPQAAVSGTPRLSPDLPQTLESNSKPSSLNFSSSGNNEIEVAPSSWFLQADTWSIDHSQPDLAIDSPVLRITDFKSFIRTVRGWLVDWVRDNHSPFMHSQLHAELGLPSCIQDAFAAVAVYESKNEKNEDVVMGIIEENANRLLNQQRDDTNSNLGVPCSLRTAEHLARVQALFIYQFIRLFDGDIRQRAQAESHMQTLSEWNSKLWASTNLDACLQTSFGYGGLFSQDLSDGRDNDPAGRQWRDWLLAESIRRIWLLSNYTHCVYLAIRDGEALCAGGVSFTARRGLWDAPSALTWTRIVRAKDPLLISAYKTAPIFQSVLAAEVDVFCLSIMSIMWDVSRLDFWASQSGTQLDYLLSKR